MNELCAKNLTVRIGKRDILQNANLKLLPGEISAIAGPSGAGKTTLLRHLAFLDRPSAGEVVLRVNGKEFSSRSLSKPWPNITCVFQKQFLWPHLTVRENVEAPLVSLGRPPADANASFELFQMHSYLDRYPNEISGGEAQRAALARSFALKPQFILLDEAHTFLDLKQQLTLNEHLETLKASGIGLLVITHSFSFIRRHADRFFVVDNNSLIDVPKENGNFRLPTSSPFLNNLAEELL